MLYVSRGAPRAADVLNARMLGVRLDVRVVMDGVCVEMTGDVVEAECGVRVEGEAIWDREGRLRVCVRTVSVLGGVALGCVACEVCWTEGGTYRRGTVVCRRFREAMWSFDGLMRRCVQDVQIISGRAMLLDRSLFRGSLLNGHGKFGGGDSEPQYQGGVEVLPPQKVRHGL